MFAQHLLVERLLCQEDEHEAGRAGVNDVLHSGGAWTRVGKAEMLENPTVILPHQTKHRVNVNRLPTLFRIPTSDSEGTSNRNARVPAARLHFPALTRRQLLSPQPLLFGHGTELRKSAEGAAWMFKFQGDLMDRVLFLNKYILKKRQKLDQGKKKKGFHYASFADICM